MLWSGSWGWVGNNFMARPPLYPAVARFAAQKPWDKVVRLDPESCSRRSNLVVPPGDSARIKLEGAGPRKPRHLTTICIPLASTGILLHYLARTWFIKLYYLLEETEGR